MMTFEELAAEGGDASFSLQLGDNVLGTLGDTDIQDIHTARLYAGHTYTFSLSYFFISYPITLEISGGSDVFALAPPIGWLGFQTFSVEFTPTASGTYSFDLGTTAPITLIYDFRFVTDVVPQGTDERDVITGSIIGDYVDLAGGDDYMRGLAGDDTILGGAGRDRILGDNGDDSIDGGAADDYLIGGQGRDILIGGAGRDKIEGDGNSDTIAGGSGNDVIVGDDGGDLIFGGGNNDRISGGRGNDTIYASSGNDRLQGNGGDDELWAGNGRDQIRGGTGNDTILSGGGDDEILGGSGADVFIFGAGMDEDTIGDFEDGIDQLDFSYFGYTQLSDLTILQSGDDAIVAVDANWFLTLTNFDSILLDDSDFIWAAVL